MIASAQFEKWLALLPMGQLAALCRTAYQVTLFWLMALLGTALLASACQAYIGPEEQMDRWEDCEMSKFDTVTYEQALEVRNRNRPLIKRQPNYTGSGVGAMHGGDPELREVWGETIGIFVRTSEPIDHDSVPEEDRIGDCLEGVPVRFEIASGTVLQSSVDDPEE